LWQGGFVKLTSVVEHRPWPLPNRPWIMVQVWRDLLFCHWPVPVSAVRQHVPEQLEIDTFDGRAWVSVTPFHMSVRPRGLPVFPGMTKIPELNCRTYVRPRGPKGEDKAGIWFFSLDCGSRAAVWGARTFYYLPYFYSEMRVRNESEAISYSSRRARAVWRGVYAPNGPVRRAMPGSAEHWLSERYCLYTIWKGRTYRGEIHHVPWPLQDAQASVEENSVIQAAGLDVASGPTLVSFARELKVLIWPLERVAS
jgi:uncharacterized protein YqjF (DUF2071 family)